MERVNNSYVFGISCKQQDWVSYLDEIDTDIFNHVELNIYDVSQDSVIYDKAYLDKIKELSEKKKISLSLHALDGINLGEKIPRLCECSITILAETLSIAEYIGAKWVTVHLGTAGFSSAKREKKSKRLDIAAKSIDKAIELSETNLVKIAIENLYKYDCNAQKSKLGDSPEEIKYVIDHVDRKDRIVFLFDVGHANILSSLNANSEDYYSLLKDYLIASHVHFNDGINDEHKSLKRYEMASKDYRSFIQKNDLKEITYIFESYSMKENMESYEVMKEILVKGDQ